MAAPAVRHLRPLLDDVTTPLVFSNGDDNPGNFPSDGQRLTGFVDFAGACFNVLSNFESDRFSSLGLDGSSGAGSVARGL